ncbi:MAG: CBS domain-containing protein [Nitrospirota bacterium]
MPTKKKTKKAKAGTKKEFGLMMVSQVMQKQVQAVHLKTNGDVIASLMIEGFGAVPVVDAKDKLVGIIARRDVLHAYLASGRA